MTVRTKIVKIGNSQGIRIAKPLLEQTGISGDVELEVRNGSIIIHPAQDVREGWGEAFASMAELGEDRLLDPETGPTDWDDSEWVWE